MRRHQSCFSEKEKKKKKREEKTFLTTRGQNDLEERETVCILV